MRPRGRRFHLGSFGRLWVSLGSFRRDLRVFMLIRAHSGSVAFVGFIWARLGGRWVDSGAP